MAMVHFDVPLGTWIGQFNHHHLGRMDVAQGFVFLSGLVVGMVYGRMYLRRPEISAVAGPVATRVLTIWRYHAALVLMMLVAALALAPDAPGELRPFIEAPVAFTTFSMLLVSATAHMGILPMYVFFLVVTPFALRALHQGRDAIVLLLMLLFWLVAQLEIVEMIAIGVQGLLRQVDIGVRLGIYFNAFGWQVMYFSGLWLGFRFVQGRLDLSALETPVARSAFLIAGAAMALLVGFHLIIRFELFGAGYNGTIFNRTSRSALSPLQAITFLLNVIVIAWLLGPGLRDRAAWVRGLARLVDGLVRLRPLVFLGQHSLFVFAGHIVVFYAIAILLDRVEPGAGWREAIMLGGLASLFLFAALHAWWQGRGTAPLLAGRR